MTCQAKCPESAASGKYLAALFFSILGALLPVATANFVVDPGNIFAGYKFSSVSLEEKIASALASGSNVATSLSFDIAKMKLKQKEYRPGQYQTMVLGSSRVMEIRPDMLSPGTSFYNTFVSSANLEDILGMYYNYTLNQSPPKEVLIGVDPWIFNPNLPISREILSVSSDRMIRQLALIPNQAGSPAKTRQDSAAFFLKFFTKAPELISWGYTSETCRVLAQRLASPGTSSDRDYYLTASDFDQLRVFRQDGTMGFEPAYRERTEKEVSVNALAYATHPHGLDHFTSMNTDRQRLFEAFLDYLAQNKVKVTLYLPPYHPDTYTGLAKEGGNSPVNFVESYLRDLCTRKGLALRGSFNPQVAGCVGSEYYDATHVKGFKVRSLLNPAPNKNPTRPVPPS